MIMGLGGSVPASVDSLEVFVESEDFEELISSVVKLRRSYYSCFPSAKVKIMADREVLRSDYLYTMAHDVIYDVYVLTQSMSGSSYKHRFLFFGMAGMRFYVTADYYNSGRVHIGMSSSERRVLARRPNSQVKEVRSIRTNIMSILEYSARFAEKDFSTFCHNCRDFVSYILDNVS